MISKPEAEDKVNVGLTADGSAALKAVMETGWFDLELDAYRAAIAVALAQGLNGSVSPGGFETKYNVGSLDRDGSLRTLILTILPAVGRPYEAAERLADAGIRILRNRLVDDEMSLRDALTSGTKPQTSN